MKKKKVCIFTLYSKKGASSNYRILMFVDDLKKDFDVQVFEFWNDMYVTTYMNDKKKYVFQICGQYIKNICSRIGQIIFTASKYDVVIIQKGVIPYLPVDFIGFLRRKGCKVIFDVDDAIFVKKHDYSDKIAAFSNITICGNNMLKSHYEKVSRHTLVFPTVDDTRKYIPYRQDTYSKKIIGWIGGGSTISNLNMVIEPVNRIIERHPEVKFKIICDKPYGMERKFRNVKFVKWNIDTYKKEMSDFSVGIMPLEDTEFNRGKCGFKLIQYFNLEKPVIASPVGVNAEIVGDSGFTAKNSDDWVAALEKLLFNPDAYLQCVKNIKDVSMKQYSYEKAVSRWRKLIEEI